MTVEGLESASGIAGRYAQTRYDAGLRSWRRGLWKPFALTSAPMMGFGLIVYALNLDAWLPWFAGAVFGIGLSLVVFFRDEPPAYLRHWREGAKGERLTAKELDRLDPSAWRVLHDVQLPGRKANLDHVVVGPAGVFLIETKNWTGSVDVVDGVPVQGDGTIRRQASHWHPSLARRLAAPPSSTGTSPLAESPAGSTPWWSRGRTSRPRWRASGSARSSPASP